MARHRKQQVSVADTGIPSEEVVTSTFTLYPTLPEGTLRVVGLHGVDTAGY
jgi:hypothetical protein